MILLIPCLLIGLPSPRQGVVLPWAPTLKRVAKEMDGFTVDGRRSKATLQRLTRVFDKAGVRARYDDATQTQIPGLFVSHWTTLVPVAGDRNAFVILLHRVDARTVDAWTDTAMALFTHHAGHWRVAVVDEHDEALGVLPESAARVGNRLLVAGLSQWLGNSPRVCVRSYVASDQGWRVTSEQVSEDESWDVPRLRLSPDRKTVEPVQIESRTYPEHLDSCHATANLAMIEGWSFPDSQPKLEWRRRRSTPFNALDELYPAILSGDKEALHRHSASATIAKHLEALAARAESGSPSVRYPNSVSFIESTAIGVENLGVTFHFKLRKGVWVVDRLEPLPSEEG